MGGIWRFSFHGLLRDDAPTATMDVLECWAAGAKPSEQQLAALPTGVQAALAYSLPSGGWMPYGEIQHGVPVMISTHRGRRILTMNMFVHEDAFAEGGWRFLSWIFDLFDRSFSGPVGMMWHDEGGDVELFVQVPSPEGSRLATVTVTRDPTERDQTEAFSVRRVILKPTDSFATDLSESGP